MLTPQPSEFPRRSPLYRWHLAAGAEFAEHDGAASPERYPDPPADAAVCGIADLSLLPRFGVKGWEAWATLARLAIERPGANNRASRMAGGGLALRLGDNEALLLGEIAREAPLLRRAEGLPAASGFYPVPRRDTHAWLLLLGARVPPLLAKVCAIDFRLDRYPELTVTQTMVARVGAVVVRCDLGGVPAFHLLADTPSAIYLWQALIDAAAEHGGHAIGFAALRRLSSSTPA